MNQLSLDIGHTLKRDGQAAAIRSDWAACAIAALRKFVTTKPHAVAFAIEDFRSWGDQLGRIARAQPPQRLGRSAPDRNKRGLDSMDRNVPAGEVGADARSPGQALRAGGRVMQAVFEDETGAEFIGWLYRQAKAPRYCARAEINVGEVRE